MSEFTKTMRAWRRMCNAFSKRYGDDCCQYCRLHQKGCGVIWEIQEGTFDTIAETVDDWAAENPEPVYPTWAEWLEEMGLTRRSVTAARRILGTDSSQETAIPFIVTLSSNASSPIPADIAEKLGLEPKRGNEND